MTDKSTPDKEYDQQQAIAKMVMKGVELQRDRDEWKQQHENLLAIHRETQRELAACREEREPLTDRDCQECYGRNGGHYWHCGKFDKPGHLKALEAGNEKLLARAVAAESRLASHAERATSDGLAEPKHPFEVAQLRQKMREIFCEYGVGDGTPGWIEHTDQDGKLKRDTLSFEGELIFGLEALLSRSRPADSRDAERKWLDNNMTFYDVQPDGPEACVAGPNIPVLAAVSKRIWYHATDNQSNYPFSAVLDAAMSQQEEK